METSPESIEKKPESENECTKQTHTATEDIPVRQEETQDEAMEVDGITTDKNEEANVEIVPESQKIDALNCADKTGDEIKDVENGR